MYSFQAFKGDIAFVIFDNMTNYTFNILEVDDAVDLNLEGTTLIISQQDLTYLDFDHDKLNDLEINFNGKHLTFTYLKAPIPGKLIPIISTKKVINEPGIESPKGFNFIYLYILLFLIVIILIIIIYHSAQLRGLKKSKKIKTFTLSPKEKMKIDRKIEALEQAYSSGYISKTSYEAGKKEIYNKSYKRKNL